VLLGLHEDLNEAVRTATRAALSLVTAQTGLDRATADGIKGVHFIVPKGPLRAVRR
jgi:hypothetical protein